MDFQGYAPLRSVFSAKILPAVSILTPRTGNAAFPHASVDKYLGGTQVFRIHIRTLLPLCKNRFFSLLFNFMRLHRSSGWLRAFKILGSNGAICKSHVHVTAETLLHRSDETTTFKAFTCTSIMATAQLDCSGGNF